MNILSGHFQALNIFLLAKTILSNDLFKKEKKISFPHDVMITLW